MALATRCPHCKTTFKVANDQLKLRAGLVRCGACKEIFNGIEHLLRPDAVEKSASPTPTPPEPASVVPVAETAPPIKPDTAPKEETPDIASFLRSRPATPESESESTKPAPAARPVAPAAPLDHSYHSAENDPLQRMTLVDFSYANDDTAEEDPTTQPQPQQKTQAQPKPDPNQPDPLKEAIEALQRKPLRGRKKLGRKHRKAEHDDEEEDIDEGDSEAEEPDFMIRARRREGIGRKIRLFMGIASVFMLMALAAQSTYVLRNKLAVWFPQARPTLDRVCAVLDCRVNLPAQIEAVSIESSELQALAPEKNTFSLTLLLRNHSATAQAWPNIELTLNDANEQAIARRVFLPREYLGRQQDSTGFAAKSEQSFKLFFELTEIKASGYRVYVFYP
jgi:predicted Zn finger-like uncharacterized protein